ncbi:hypothetical protein [Streptomyces sp. NRRL F-5123]|uniref:hypothetical protein n=1 Tax=Streptomyces sp. NRRL F-5123 TaxID=1463856 RepID=UPI0004E1F483|nr:hypothetical protein [Streptomyces sp. NRRL F-5123]
MILIFAAAAIFLALIACVVTLVRRGSTRGAPRAEAAHRAEAEYQRAFNDARTVHNAAAMGDGYHR